LPQPAVRPRRGRPLALRFLPRFAVAVEMRLPGAPVRRLQARGLDVKVTPFGAYLQIRLANTGNQLIAESSGSVTLTQAGEDLVTEAVDLSQFVPGTEIAYMVRFPDAPRGAPMTCAAPCGPSEHRPSASTAKSRSGGQRPPVQAPDRQ